MFRDEYDAAVAMLLRDRGVTRCCPTACASPTQGTVSPADRLALEDYGAQRERRSQWRKAARKVALLSQNYQSPAAE